MRQFLFWSLAATFSAVNCTSGWADDSNLRCAAIISQASKLDIGKTNQLIVQRGLVASMTYLNAYSIPKNLNEKEAFAAVEAERQRIASMSASAVIAEATACIQKIPLQKRP